MTVQTEFQSRGASDARRPSKPGPAGLARRWVVALGMSAVAWLSCAVPTAVAADDRNVLLLFSNNRLLPANVEFDRGFSEVLAAHPEARMDLSVEFLDAPKFSGEAYDGTIATYLRGKYAARPPEVIVVAGEIALDFVLNSRDRMFPGVPVVYQAVNTSHRPKVVPLPEDVIGSRIEYDFVRTAELALRWHPKARHLVVVTGTAPWDRDWEAQARKGAQSLDKRIAVEFLSGLPPEALRKRLGELQSDAVVFTPGYFRDGDGRNFVPREGARFIAANSAAPVYGPYPTFIGTGIVGGVMASYVTMGRLAAGATLDLLAGTAPPAVALPKTIVNQIHLDWRQARRWGIAPEAVPADALVQFKEPSFWEAYGHFVLIAGAVILVQSALIVALLVERRRRRRTASALAQSEQRMSLAAQAARLSMWIWDLGRKETGVRTPARRSSDREAAAFTDFKDVLATIHPQDRPAVERAVERALAGGAEIEVEYRVTMPDGETQWMATRGRAVDGAHRDRLLGVTLDITQRKRAEAQAEQDRAALRHMTRVSLLGQLSASIAHQLNQPLASILSNAEAAQKMLGRSPVDLVELREICNDIVAEDHRAAEVIRRLGALFKRGEPMLVPIDLNELVRDTLDLTRTNLLTRHVTPRVRLAPELPKIDGDRVQLQQLLLNLIVNAADAMAAATPEAERQLTIVTSLSGPQVEVCVADRGPGIAAADAENVFDPFWSTKAGGMGIGLAICRSIAVAHRGSLTASNAAEGGAVFCVQLPIRVTP